MAAQIEVEKAQDGAFTVRVSEGASATTHRVTLDEKDFARLSGGVATAEELIRRSFEFLLEHEAKESILPYFDLTVIARYFPQYESEIRRRLTSA